MKKFFAVLFAAILVFALCACAPAHVCGHVCPECGKCLDAECTEGVCKDKCEGHHVCESACPICGKCTNAACTEYACKDKCAGHHVCESVCPECGKCTDIYCSEYACKDKCEGHESVVTTKDVILIATYTVNFRLSGTSALVTAADQIAVVDYGTPFDQESVVGAVMFYTYAGAAGIPSSMVSGPVTLGFNSAGDLVSVTEIAGARLDVQPYQVTYADGVYTLEDGTALALDTTALVDGSATHVLKKEQGLKINSCKIDDARFGLVTTSDDLYTLWDTDGDGRYDFARMVPLLNAGEILYIDESTITIRGGFGSSTSMYNWVDGSVLCDFVLEDAALAGTLKKGDFVNYYFRWDCSTKVKPFNSMSAKLVIHSKSDVTVGALESAEGSGVNLSATVDGTVYKWSDFIINVNAAGLFDGAGGVNAGRTLMTAANYGTSYGFVFDKAGRVVYAYVPRDYAAMTEVVLYATPGWNVRSAAGKMLLRNPGAILVVPRGDDLIDRNAFELTYVGEENIDHLVGLPVTLTKDAEGNVTKVSLRGKAAEYMSGDGTVSGGRVYDKDGYEIPLDTAALCTNFAKNTFARLGFSYVGSYNVLTNQYFFASNGDTKITLVDTNGDGLYDFARSNDIVTLKIPLVIEETAVLGEVAFIGETSQVYGTYGSIASTGWINGVYMFQIEVPEGVKLKDGGYVNGYIRIDYFSETNSHNYYLPATFVVTSVCEAKTGVFTDIVATDARHISVKVDGVEMQWSDTVSTASYSDGADGVNAGRTLMKAENNGKTFTYCCDEAGRIVFARLAD